MNRYLRKLEILVIFEAIILRYTLSYYKKGGLEDLNSWSVVSIFYLRENRVCAANSRSSPVWSADRNTLRGEAAFGSVATPRDDYFNYAFYLLDDLENAEGRGASRPQQSREFGLPTDVSSLSY
ncbi:hypothetical protein FHL15_009793 [Xylaria flabelliformis]|uniref:Uncharacterized protein n=1 Tax=Xylaria flabelliformis TaxID=2512241 RepID=A0A553HN52_9PEZI|nr:hypothetical protein FHL15_009793 [Xylaria flabelliformis]